MPPAARDPATDSDPAPATSQTAGNVIGTPFGLDPLCQAGVPPLPQPTWLDWFGEVPAALAQRLTCDASVWRIVLDPPPGSPTAHLMWPAGSQLTTTVALAEDMSRGASVRGWGQAVNGSTPAARQPVVVTKTWWIWASPQ